MLVAGPSHSSSFHQFIGNNATIASRPDTSKSISNGSVISISSTSSTSASSSSGSSRYSLIKSVAQQINRGTELIKQKVHNTILCKLTPAKLQQYQKLIEQTDLNASDLCVKPRDIHKAPSRCSSDGDDSLKSELNHFKPIFPTTPKRSTSSKNILRIPSVRPDSVPSIAECFTPSKSPFKPIDPLTPRRSAFSIVNLGITLSPNSEEVLLPLPSTSEHIEEKKPTKRGRKRKVVRVKTTPQVKREKSEGPKPKKIQKVEVQSRFSTRVARKSYNNLSEEIHANYSEFVDPTNKNILKEIMIDQKKCEKMIEQERLDFEFAQKLQNKLNRMSTGAPVKRKPYTLRRKSNIQNEELPVPTEKRKPAAKKDIEQPVAIRRSTRNKC